MDTLQQIVAPAIAEAGLACEDVRLAKDGSATVVRVTVDLPADEIGSLSSDRLDAVSRAVSAAVDAADESALPEKFTLEVTTPGISRPLTEVHHFKRARTRLVKLTGTDGSTTRGRLTDVTGSDDEGWTAVLDEGKVTVPLSEVRRGKIEVEF
jgi:ribosome maturation factor RimP